MSVHDPDLLRRVLTGARELGFLGPADLDDHLDNADGFVEVLSEASVTKVVDLGSGGGVPAIPMAVALAETEFVLVERGSRRCAFLREAVVLLGLEARVEVVEGDAESTSRDHAWSGIADAVTARSFGPPAVTAEAATRFLGIGGRLVVSEPPDSSQSIERWPEPGLSVLGFGALETRRANGCSYAVLRREGPVEARYPRRDAVTRKRPLF